MELKEIIDKTLSYLHQEKVILYPTDTIWGLGCDAYSPKGIERIQQIKQRPLTKSFILLAASYQMLAQYVKVPTEVVAFLGEQQRPTSVIYTEVYDPHLPMAEDHSIDPKVQQAVDWVVPYHQENQTPTLASQLVMWQDGQLVYIRR